MNLFPTINQILLCDFFSVFGCWFGQGGCVLFISVAMFSKPSFFVLGSCIDFPINCCNLWESSVSSEDSGKNSQTDNLPLTSLGSSHWLGFGFYLVIILPKLMFL